MLQKVLATPQRLTADSVSTLKKCASFFDEAYRIVAQRVFTKDEMEELQRTAT
jgi:hypothetical protein